MKVNSNKGICPYFSRNVLYGCRYDHDELPLGYPSTNLPPCQIQELPCFFLVLIRLEFIIGLIESACTSLLLPNPDPLLCKNVEAFSDIDVRLESIICEEGSPLWEITNNLKIIWRNRCVELDKYIINILKKATLLTSIFLIPGSAYFTTFAQVSSSMYAALFGITQDPSGNPYLVTKLLPLSLGCTFVPFARNITGPFTSAALPTRRTVMENLKSLQFLSWRGLSSS